MTPDTDTQTDPAAVSGHEDAPAATIRRTTSVYLPVELLDELDRIAAELERSRTWVIEKAVVEWLMRNG